VGKTKSGLLKINHHRCGLCGRRRRPDFTARPRDFRVGAAEPVSKIWFRHDPGDQSLSSLSSKSSAKGSPKMLALAISSNVVSPFSTAVVSAPYR